MIVVDLDTYDVEKIELLAQARAVGKRPNVKNRRVSKESDAAIDYMGVRGEYAFAKEYDLAVQTWPGIGGDPGFDFHMRGRSIDVKATSYSNGRLLLPTWQEDKPSDVLVLAVTKQISQAYLVGWISKKFFFQQSYRLRLCDDGPLNLVMDQKDLWPIESLVDALQRPIKVA